MTAESTPARVRRIRLALGETRAQFAARFARTVRTVEDWECERARPRSEPDKFVMRELERLEKKIAKRAE